MALDNITVLSDVLKTIIEYLPHVVFAAIILALGWLFGRLVSFLIYHITGKMALETIFRKTSIGRAILRDGYTPNSFFAVIGKGAIYLFATISALKLLAIPILTDMIQSLIEYLPNFIGGALILIVGFIFVDWIAEIIEKGSNSIAQASLLGGFVRLLLYFVIITISLSQMKIDVTILYIFAQASAWSIAIALGIGFGWYLKDKIGPWLEKLKDREEKINNAT